MEKTISRFIINLGLFVSGIASVFSGIFIQVKYHMGNHGSIAADESLSGIDYHGWSVVHKTSIIVLTLLLVCHIYLHWNWYKALIARRLFAKNQQVLVFSLLFLLVAITGLTPWFIDLLNGSETQRKAFIEIHDKIALIFSVYLVLHIISRLKWYFNAFDKIRNKPKF